MLYCLARYWLPCLDECPIFRQRYDLCHGLDRAATRPDLLSTCSLAAS